MVVDCRNNGKCDECKYNIVKYSELSRSRRISECLDRNKIYNYKCTDGQRDRSKPDYIHYLDRYGFLESVCEILK